MIRSRLAQLLVVAAVKVENNRVPEHIKQELAVRKKALINEINGYRNALSKVIATN